jgi:hypothetical protein
MLISVNLLNRKSGRNIVMGKNFFLSLISGLFLFFLISAGQQAGAEQPENILERALTSRPISEKVTQAKDTEETDGTYMQAGSKETSSPEKEVQIRLDDKLKAFFSFGAPAVRDLSGEQEGLDYRATVGFNIPL